MNTESHSEVPTTADAIPLGASARMWSTPVELVIALMRRATRRALYARIGQGKRLKGNATVFVAGDRIFGVVQWADGTAFKAVLTPRPLHNSAEFTP